MPVKVNVLPAKDNIVKFVGKPKVEPLVYSCGECGGQMFYVEANPTNKEGEDTYPCLHRCFKCNRIVDLYGLFFNAESDE